MTSGRSQSGKAKKVVIYSAPWCGVCKRAKRFFRVQGIPFRELDVEKNRMARREMERMNARGLPVILVGGKRMNGFSEKRFMELYRT
jgi:glutaredoxin